MFTDDKINLMFQEMTLDLLTQNDPTIDGLEKTITHWVNKIFALCDTKLKEGVDEASLTQLKANIVRTWRLFEAGKKKALSTSDDVIPEFIKEIIHVVDYKKECMDDENFMKVYNAVKDA